MKQKLINSIKDFLNTIIGENENVCDYLESYITSEISPPLEQVRLALEKFVDNLNEINVTLKNNSETCKPISSTSKNSSEGISLKPSQHHCPNEAIASGSSTKTNDQSHPNENGEDSLPDKSTLQNGTSVLPFNKNLVQIVADKSEIERRIASFIECKRMDVDEENRREFCSDFFPEHGDSEQCARTSAVFVARSGGRSHVVVSRVVNSNGPQLRVLSCTPSMTNLPSVKSEPGSMMHNSHLNVAGGLPIKQEPTDVSSGIEERLKNMEAHLKVVPPESVSNKSEIFERLKALEKRILFLESISPEYFNLQLQSSNLKKRKMVSSLCRTEPTNKDLSLVEIDERIKRLRTILKKKQLNLDDT